MDSSSRDSILHNLMLFNSHRQIEIGQSNLERLNLLLECSRKTGLIRELIFENMSYKVRDRLMELDTP